MASPKDMIVCHVCGFKNEPTVARCTSCGAKLEEISATYTDEDIARKRNQQQGFDIKWAAIAFLVYLLLQVIVLYLMPMLIDTYDPQGFGGLLVSLAVWFAGGLLVGFLSPGKTFYEPAVGALLAVVPTIFYLIKTTPAAPEHLGGGFQVSILTYVVMGLMGGMISLFGAFLGERAQDKMAASKK